MAPFPSETLLSIHSDEHWQTAELPKQRYLSCHRSG